MNRELEQFMEQNKGLVFAKACAEIRDDALWAYDNYCNRVRVRIAELEADGITVPPQRALEPDFQSAVRGCISEDKASDEAFVVKVATVQLLKAAAAWIQDE